MVYAIKKDPTLVLFNEEVRFHIGGYVNSHNSYRSVQCPTLIHDLSLHDVTVSVWCDTNGSVPAITRTSSCFWGHNHSDMSHWNIICQHLSDPTEPEPYLQGDNATAHTAKNSMPCSDSVLCGRKNKRRNVASSFTRSKTVWFLCGHIKCTEIILALKMIWKKAFGTLYASFINRTSTCNGVYQLNKTIFNPYFTHGELKPYITCISLNWHFLAPSLNKYNKQFW